jgi:hypothetical protein
VNAVDTVTGITREVGQLRNGTLPNGNQSIGTASVALSSDGSYAVFVSSASNLAHRDRNQALDVFLQRLH